MCVKHASKLIKVVMDNSLSQNDSKYAVSWMEDKEEMQLQMQRIMYRLFQKKLVTAEQLISIIELSYGRELSLKLGAAAANRPILELLDEISVRYPQSMIFGFFESESGVHFFAISTSKKDIIISDSEILSIAEAEEMNAVVNRTYANTSPGVLKFSELRLKSFRDFYCQSR